MTTSFDSSRLLRVTIDNNYRFHARVFVRALGESRPRLTAFGRVLPSARLIRTTLFPERNVPDIRFTLAVMQWAQVVAHDVTLLTEKSGESPALHTVCPGDRLPSRPTPPLVPKLDQNRLQTVGRFSKRTATVNT